MMIVLPLKKSEHVKLSEHIGPALSQTYPVHELKNELNAFDQLRQSALGVSANSVGRDVLFRYLAQLELLSLHIPKSPWRIEFNWHDLYAKSNHSQPSIAFEKACILYNLAAVLSALGAENAANQDFKSAYHDFCCAAGILNSVQLHFLHAPSQDVKPEVMAVLEKLMMAQAQHAFFARASAPKPDGSVGNLGLLAKLGMAASTLYSDAADQLLHLLTEEKWGDKDNLAILKTNAQKLKAEAYEFQAQFNEEKHKHGEAIACLQETKRLTDDKRKGEDLSRKIAALERDNRLIYHDSVPAEVPVIMETVAAKALPLSSVYHSTEVASRIVGRDLLEKVVPLKVHEQASLYSEFTAQFLREQQEKADIASLELSSALEYMDLPAAISRLRVSIADLAQVPPEVLEYSASARRTSLSESDFNFESRRKKILGLAAGAAPGNTIRESLVLAAKTDQELYIMFKSIKSDLDLLSNLDSLISSYKMATKPTNSRVPAVDLLSLDESSSESADNLDQELDQVAGLVSKLHKIRTERQSSLTDLREKVRNDDITQAIVAHQDSEDIKKAVFEPEIAKFDQAVRRIDATVRLQKSVLNETVHLWTKVLASPAAKQRQEEQKIAREHVNDLTSRFLSAYQTLEALKNGHKNALAFYNDLEKQAMGVSSGPPRPPKLPAKPNDGLNGYDTPSAYSPSMYR